MLRYIGKRIIGVIPTLIIVVTFVFFFVRLIPGDPARLVAGPQATLEDVQVVREELGLDKPIHEQYITYVTGLLKGDLGTSLRTKRPVAVEVSNRYANTAKLTLLALAWSTIVGVLLGVWSGRHRSHWQDDTGCVRHIASFFLGWLYADHGIFRESEMVPDHGCGFTEESRITFDRTGIQYRGNHCPLYQILYYRSIKR